MSSFDVTAIDLPRYGGLEPVPCDLDAAQVRRRFAPVGGRPVPWPVEPAARTIGAVLDRLERWAEEDPQRSSVLFWAGHGFSNGQEAFLWVPGDPDTRLMPEQFAAYLRTPRPEPYWRIVVIQACGAGLFARRVWEHLERHNATAGLVLVAAGPDQGDGYAGDFRTLLDRVLSRPTSNDAEFGLQQFVAALVDEAERRDRRVHRGSLLGREGSFLPVRSLGPLATPVDVYRELRTALAELPPDSDVGFAHPGLGVAVGEFGWYFSGRQADRTALLDWLTTADHGLYVLTGDSGCGKSAILGNVWLHAHPEIRGALGRLGRAGPDWPEAEALPPVDGALPLTGATLTDVVARLAGTAGVTPPPAAETPEQLIGALADRLSARPPGPPLTVFADGLDEAAQPGPIAAALRRAGEVPGLRIVVTARAGRLDDLGRGRAHVTVAEVVRSGDAAAIEEYVVRRLTADGPGDEDRVKAAARRIARRRGSGGPRQPFLHARLVVREILADPGLLTRSESARLTALIRLDPGGLFEVALRRMNATGPVEPFLRALAFGRGLGLPRDEPLWLAAAAALAGAGDGSLGEDDLDEVLDIAGPYVLLDAADGRSVYRLAQQSFRTHLRERPDAAETAAAEAAITRALLRAAGTPLHPYLRRHLCEHAAAAGAAGWDALAARPDVLDQVDASSVVAGVMAEPDRFGTLPPAVLGTVVTSHLALAATPADRTGLRRLGTARISGTWTAAQSAAETAGPGAAWWPVWARIRRDPPHVTLAAYGRPVPALTALPGPDGTPALASGTADGTVQVWDLTRGEPLAGLPATGGRVFAVAALHRPGGAALLVARYGEPVLVRDADGRTPDLRLSGAEHVRSLLGLDVEGHGPLVVTGGVDGAVRLWSPGTGAAVGAALTGHTGPVHALAAIGPLLATAGHDGTVRLWDPRTQRLVRRFPDAHTRPVRAMTVAGGSLVTGDDAGAVRRWDPAPGRPPGDPIDLGCRVTALAACPVPGASGLVLAGDEHGRLRFVEPRSGSAWGGPIAAHDGPVRRVVVLDGPGGGPRHRLATAGEDGRIRVWDLARLVAAAHPSDPPEAEAAARTAPAADRATILVRTSDGDRTLLTGAGPGGEQHWDWDTGRPVGDAPRTGAAYPLTTEPGRTFLGEPPKPVALPGRAAAAVLLPAAAGPALAAVAAPDGAVAVVEETATEWTVRRHLIGHTRPAAALAVLERADAPPLLISGGPDGTVRIWDGDGLAHLLPLGTPVRALTAGGRDIAVATDDGTAVIRLDQRWFTGDGGSGAEHA